MRSKINFYSVIISLLVTISVYSPVLAEEQKMLPSSDAFPSLEITEQKINLPLISTLILALKNNLNIKFQSLNPKAAETNIMREKGTFDTTFSSQLNKTYAKEQTAFALSGSDDSGTTLNERTNFEGGLKKKFTAGTQAELKLYHQEGQSDAGIFGLNPEYNGEIKLSLTQPLLKDFGISIGKSQIKIATLNFKSSENEFKKNVMDILFDIESSYWDLSFKIADLKSKQKSLKLAEDLLREFKIKIEAGSLAPIEIYQAESEVALRIQDVIIAEAAVEASEDRLKSGLNLYEDEKYWNVAIIPSDKPETETAEQSLTKNLAIALEMRPDLKQAKLNLESSNVQLKYTKNQKLPRVDLMGSIGSTGLAGRSQDTSFIPGVTAESPWTGHWDDVYDHMATGDYYNYMIGVKLEIPLENRRAKSQYNLAKIKKMQSLTNIKNTENIIISEVREALRYLHTTRKVIDSAIASLKFSQEKLKAEEKKYNVGMATTHDLLEFQEDLAAAESTLAVAQAEHRIAVAKLAKVKGTLLEEKGLSL